jgi:hypothetical protein
VLEDRSRVVDLVVLRLGFRRRREVCAVARCAARSWVVVTEEEAALEVMEAGRPARSTARGGLESVKRGR